MNLSLYTSIARRAAMALAASGHTTSGSGGGLLWHHHHDDEILYCCRRFFRLIKPSRDWRAGVPKCAPQSALQLGSFKKLVGPALCAPYSVPPKNDFYYIFIWRRLTCDTCEMFFLDWNIKRIMRLFFKALQCCYFFKTTVSKIGKIGTLFSRLYGLFDRVVF